MNKDGIHYLDCLYFYKTKHNEQINELKEYVNDYLNTITNIRILQKWNWLKSDLERENKFIPQ